MNFGCCWKQAQTINSMFERDEAIKLYQESCKAKDVIVHIGVWMGRSVAISGLANPSSVVHAVDPWSIPLLMKKKRDFLQKENIKDWRQTFINNMSALNISPQVHDGPSQNIASEFDDNTIDLLLIDGCHSRVSVQRDIQLWYDKLKPNGVILGHDWDMLSIREAVHNLITVHEHAPKWFLHRRGIDANYIVTEGYNCEANFLKLLPSLERFNSDDNILISTYPSKDNTVELVDSYCKRHVNWKHITYSKVLCLSAALNRAIDLYVKRLDIKDIAHLDSDCEVLHAKWVEGLRAAMDDNTWRVDARGIVGKRSELKAGGHYACLMRSDIFKEHGLRYDENLTERSQDMELAYRVKVDTGLIKKHASDVVVKHHNANFGAKSEQQRAWYLHQAGLQLIKKYPSSDHELYVLGTKRILRALELWQLSKEDIELTCSVI